MKELENLTNMLNAILGMVKLDSEHNEPMYVAYNRGAEAMKNQVEYYINNVLKVGEQ